MIGHKKCYLTERSEQLQVAKSALSQVLNALMSHISQADGHYSDFSSELGEIANGLSADTTVEDLNGVIDRAMRATNAALERGAELKQEFSSLAAEMQQVRSEMERSHEEARTDSLTGVNNRLAFQEELDNLPTAADEDTHAPCLLMVDVDFFKRVNDTYGHQTGDHALRIVAQEIKAILRGRDLVARHGGEEFAVLLRDTPRSGCMAVAENIRAGIERTQIRLLGDSGAGKSLSVTASLGGAWLRGEEAIDAFVDRADRALYQSKKNGRNRVTWENRDTEA